MKTLFVNIIIHWINYIIACRHRTIVNSYSSPTTFVYEHNSLVRWRVHFCTLSDIKELGKCLEVLELDISKAEHVEETKIWLWNNLISEWMNFLFIIRDIIF